MTILDSTAAQIGRPRIGRPWAVAATAVSYVLATLLASFLANPAHPKAFAVVPIVLAMITGAVGAVTIGPLAQRLPIRLPTRLAVVTMLVYLLMTVSNAVEALLFIKDASALILLTGAVLAVGIAVPATVLWPPPETGRSVPAALRSTLNSRPWWAWSWRFVVASLVWVPVYFVFAAADAPFVHRYYAEQHTPFVRPDDGLVALAELSRGVLHALVLAVLAALLLRSRRSTWWWLALAFAVLNSWLPLIQRSDWPLYLRTANLVEITCDAIIYGGLVTVLLTARRDKDRQ
ncbi:hypothetical protein ACPPVO_20060 [Dactylosporangium sp. McL0621]|uniref:hypothetical protein n=1 Tax=Dactylosporangium sp. McL0621 TaxID=3415678 RepID=UPI003CE954F8